MSESDDISDVTRSSARSANSQTFTFERDELTELRTMRGKNLELCFSIFLSGAPLLTLQCTLTLATSFASAGPGGGAAPFDRGWTPAS